MDAAAGGQDDLLDAYLAAMKIQGRSEKTLDRYTYIIRRLTQSVNTNTRRSPYTIFASIWPARKSAGSATEHWRARARCFLHISTGYSANH